MNNTNRWPLTRRRTGRKVLHPVLYGLSKLLLNVCIENSTQIPSAGPLILAYNHVHYLDPFVLSAVMPRYAVAISKMETLYAPIIGTLMYHYGVIFLRRGEGDIAALRHAEKVLQAGHILLLSPEGTRSKTGGLIVPKEGLGFLARRTAALVQPVGITGTPQFPATWKRLRRTSVRIIFGQPFRIDWESVSGRRTTAYRVVTDQVMVQLARLLPPRRRGVYNSRMMEETPYLIPAP